MIKEKKLKVSEFSRNFGDRFGAKDVLDVYAKHFDKKISSTTASLDHDDLDLLFDIVSKKYKPESMTRYFNMMNNKSEKKIEEKPKSESKQKTSEKVGTAPFKKKEKNANPTQQPKTKGEIHLIDTRGSAIDLDKYNEKYENLGPSSGKTYDTTLKKQKLNQKSKQYRNTKGMRSKKRETEADRLKRIQAQRKNKPITVEIPDEISVGAFASRLKMTAAEVIKKLMSEGVMAGVNDNIDFDTAAIVAEELGAKVKKEIHITIEEQIIDSTEDTDENLETRDPVVVVMGHVDHGKTSILDAIRNTDVTSTEAGGITQAIGAYRVNVGDRQVTFLDTPGHSAFTAMRARGAMATDIAVLVVAADDGIMPQTVEAINHAKAANVQVIVAINKMDKPGANPQKILQELTNYELVPEEWGGDVICVPVSAKTKDGIDKLLENILLVADMLEMKANPARAAKGVVIEAKLDKGRGPIATLLVQNGTLHLSDIVVAGTSVGRVRTMHNERGFNLKEAGPSVPVEIMGLSDVPQAGDIFDAVSDEKLARELVEQRKQEQKEEEFNRCHKVTLDNLFDSINEGELKELNLIVKADVQGSVEAVSQNLEKLSNEEVKVKVMHGGVGAISESDVMLANASNAIIVGFDVRPDSVAKTLAERDGVDIRTYRIIYDCIDEMQAAIKGMLAPEFTEVQLGRAEVRSVFKLSSSGVIAGSYVLEGKITRNAQIRLVRDGIVITEDLISSLRRFKDDVKDVASGYECGIGLEKYQDIKEGDIFEAFIMQENKK
ncbi:MAG: translation initiation factor IF-2 [Candidatus Fimenecus sp.]